MPSRKLLEFLRSALAGLLATAIDLAVLLALVHSHLASERAANVPALVIGGIASFALNRHFAFRATEGNLPKQLALYTLVEIIALALNGLLYDLVLRGVPAARPYFLLVRLLTSNATFVLWSFPLWRLVFRVKLKR